MARTTRRDSLSIWGWSLALSLVYAALVGATWVWLVRARIDGLAMELAVAVAAVQGSIIVAIVTGISLRRGLARRRAVRSARVRAAVGAIVAGAVAGEDPLPRARALMRIDARDTMTHLESAARSMRGEARERIEASIRALGEEMPLSAVPRTLPALASAPLLERALAAETLRGEAATLGETAIADAVASSDPDLVLAALEMLRAWRRLVAVPGAVRLPAHPDPRIREAACAALPYLIPPEGVELVPQMVARALDDPEPRVRAAAARAAGALRLSEVAERLDALIADPDAEVSLAAAFALAALPDGAAALTRHSTGTARAAAAHAFEALEKRNLGRLEAM